MLRTFFLLLIIAACPAALPLSAQDAPRDAAELFRRGDRFAKAKKYVEALDSWREAYLDRLPRMRGKPFRWPVRARFMNRKDLGAFLVKTLEEEYPDEKIDADRLAYSRLGFFSSDLDLREIIVGMMTEQVAGFYNPETKRLYLIREEPPAESEKKKKSIWDLFGSSAPKFDPQEQKAVLSHEMSHALADQHFDLYSMQRSIEDDDDLTLAYTAVVEGEAMLIMMMDMMGGNQGGPAALRAVADTVTNPLMQGLNSLSMGAAGNTGSMRRAPPIIKESLIFPYMGGMTFCGRLTKSGRWDALNDAFRSPPLSTEQIIHPEKYRGEERDDPVAIQPVGRVPLNGEWKLVKANCVGEFGVEVLLRKAVGRKKSRAAAAGWDGDLYHVYRRGENADETLLVWASVWDSDSEATEFATALLAQRGHGKDVVAPTDDGASVVTWGDGDTSSILWRRGAEVVLVENAPRAAADGLLRWAVGARKAPKEIHVRKFETRFKFGEPRRRRI